MALLLRWLFGIALCSLVQGVVGSGEVLYTSGNNVWRGEVVQLLWKPRVSLLKGFLSNEECDHLMELAAPRLKESLVVDPKTGEHQASEVRTSKGTFLNTAEDEVVERIERRVAHVTMIPLEHQEQFQILKYVDGQKYKPHYDFFEDSVSKGAEYGGQRMMTVLMYLTEVEEGGETVFPTVKAENSSPEWSVCAGEAYAIHPRKGDAIMFYGLKPNLTPDYSSLHGSCPVIKGEKWSATKWIRVSPIPSYRNPVRAPSGLRDLLQVR